MKILERAALGSERVRAGSLADTQLILNDLSAGQHVIARSGDLAPDVYPHSPVADRGDEDLRAFDVGLELLGEEVAQLLDREPLDVKGAQPRQIDCAVGPDREGSAQLRDVQQLYLEAVAWAEDVAVVGDSAALWGGGRRKFRGWCCCQNNVARN